MSAIKEQRVSLREINQHLTRYVKAVEAGEQIVITRRGKPVALLSPLPQEGRRLTAEQEAALERILSRSDHLGGKPPSRDELHERCADQPGRQRAVLRCRHRCRRATRQ